MRQLQAHYQGLIPIGWRCSGCGAVFSIEHPYRASDVPEEVRAHFDAHRCEEHVNVAKSHASGGSR